MEKMGEKRKWAENDGNFLLFIARDTSTHISY
jgi:hypothetical protein